MTHTTWGVYNIQGKLPDGRPVPSSNRLANKWFVRWRVDGREHKRTLTQKGHAKTFRDRLILAQLLGHAADQRGYPIDPHDSATARGSGNPTAPPDVSAPPSRSFEDYCENVWWPTISDTLGDRNRAGHRKNMRDAATWLRYRQGDPRIATRPNTDVGNSILLDDLNSDDIKHALVRRRNHNDRTAAVNRRRLDNAVRQPADVQLELTSQQASDRTVRAFWITLGMIVKSADDSDQTDDRCLRGGKNLAPRPRPQTPSRRIVPSVQEVFAVADAIATLGPRMPDGKPAGERFRALVLAGGTLGARPGELVAHQPDSIFVEDNITFVRFNRTEGTFYDVEAGVRGRKVTNLKHRDEDEERTIPALTAVAEAINRHIEAGYGHPDRTFTSVTGRAHLNWSNMIDTYWYPACQLVFANSDKPILTRMPPKTLRKAAINFWLDSGVTNAQAAEWAGHSEEVAQLYYAGRVNPGFAREAALLAEHADAMRDTEVDGQTGRWSSHLPLAPRSTSAGPAVDRKPGSALNGSADAMRP